MKKRIISLALILSVVLSLLCMSAAAVNADQILNGAALKPDHFLAKGSSDYELECERGDRICYFMGIDFSAEKADALIVKTIEAQTTADMTTAQKVRTLYRYLIEQTTYGNPASGTYASVYTVLVGHQGTCYDYNYVMMAFLRYLGIEAALVTGETRKASGGYTGHAWCEAYIGGKTYVFDPQVDDNITDALGGGVTYYRFCMPYAEDPDAYKLDESSLTIYLASEYSEDTYCRTANGDQTLRSLGVNKLELEELGFEQEGMVLTGWYYDKGCTRPVDLDEPLRRDLTIWAGYGVAPFQDVPVKQYYAEPVAWAVENEITSGTGKIAFSPSTDCTRAQIVTFLWRAAGSPAPKGKQTAFKDVPAEAYFRDAVLWAVENKITSGTSKTAFSPNAPCTRGQIVTFLWRSVGKPEMKVQKSDFQDVKTDQYYTQAVAWAVENEITSGTSKTTFSPGKACTRAMVVTFLYRQAGK